ncbi:hypothetical protein [Streptomyces tagetis]|uniref:Uncharacterized protein n=1 Tax=Streptomyces tagetis TaxID=2820809 RepID=A0A941B5M2_9ACTN|nr:hypothetical protein [Streptomyces sp. RG38]MBQ0825478.1 hypothetical protein [Streptomyces sp. RG38]
MAAHSLVLPPAPPGIVPYIAGWSRETLVTPRLTSCGGRLAFVDESHLDRDSWGTLWVRPTLLPKGRRGEPRLREVHPYRQRRAMRDGLCQVCARSPDDPAAPLLFLLRGDNPIRERERTASPPVCLPCAGISVQLCPYLLRHHVAATADSAPAWGLAGIVHDPVTLRPMGGDEQVVYGSPAASWVVAGRMVVELHGVTPVDLKVEFARLGRDRLEKEFARVEVPAAA